ncbi:MAG: DUF4837 family protein [Balneolaceae bacterium]
MRHLPLLFILIGATILQACSGDYRPRSIGAIDEVFVVMDSTKWSSETAMAIRETFGRELETVPTFENEYHLVFRDFRNNDELEQLKEFKNIIFAAPIDEESNVGMFVRALLNDDVKQRVRNEESFAFPLANHWVRDQWVLILTSADDDALASKINNSEESLVNNLLDREFERRKEEVFRRGEQVVLSDSLWENFGWKVRVQHDYIKVRERDQAVLFRRFLPENNRWFWGWWQDGVTSIDHVDREWINAKRDSLNREIVQGEREGSYVTTEYRRPVNIREFDTGNRLIGFETLGTWRMTNDFMGGPFVHFTYYDPDTQRLFMIEYGQFAPSVSKRRFVRQFQAMGRTFEADSTWHNGAQEPLTDHLRD